MRHTLGLVLLVAALLCLFLGITALWARNTLYHEPTFGEVVSASVAPEPVRRGIAARAVEAMLGSSDMPVARDLITSCITGLLGSDSVRATLDQAAHLGWRVLVEREGGEVTLDLTEVRDRVRGMVQAKFPEAAARIDETPSPFVVTLLEGEDLPDLSVYRPVATRWAWILLGVGVLALVVSILSDPRRHLATARVATVILSVGLALLACLAGLRLILPAALSSPEGSLLVDRAARTLTADLAVWAGLLAALGLVLAIGAAARRGVRDA